MALDAPQRLGRFQLAERVAHGGMGEIWRAVDTDSGDTVALKRLWTDRAVDADTAARLAREAGAIRRVEHDGVVRVIDSGADDDGFPYLALEWLEGENLAQRQRRAPLSDTEVLQLARQTLRTLAACHSANVIHRDIKPANIFLTPAADPFRVKLIDFGLALIADQSTRLTRSGAVMGTLYYLSPEQARGQREIDHRTDLYSFGVVLYELLTGAVPFHSDKAVAVLLRILTETPAPPRELRPSLPPHLDAAICCAMQRSTAQRFSSAEQMLAAIEANAGAARAGAVSPEQPSSDGMAATLPPSFRSSAEHRLVSLLVVQPAGSTDHELAATAARTIDQLGGIAYRLLGGVTVGVFGAGRTGGDEALRAAQAGLALRGGLGAAARLLASTLHVVMEQGLQLNTDELDRATAMLAEAPPGELVVDRATRELLGDRLLLRDVDGHQLVVALRSAMRRARRVIGRATPTVGRELEAAAIDSAFKRCSAQRAAEGVLLLGPAGIGKSRLALEALRELETQSRLTLIFEASSIRRDTPYGVLAEAAAQQIGRFVDDRSPQSRQALLQLARSFVDADEADEVAAYLAEAVGMPFSSDTLRWSTRSEELFAALRAARSDPELLRERIGWAGATLLRAAGRSGAVTLVVENLHWADSESLKLLCRVLDELEETPLFVLCTARPELLQRHPGLFDGLELSTVDVRPLGRRALRRLLTAILGPLPPELERRVAAWCEGNPYFAEEIVSWMVAQQMIVDRGAGWALVRGPRSEQLPLGVQGAIQGRLDRLEPPLKELIKAAAVLGDVFSAEGCARLGFLDAPVELKQLERLDFVCADEQCPVGHGAAWRFRHDLLRQVAYGMLPAERRRALHAAAAAWLEDAGESDPAVLAHHFELANDDARAAHYAARAGERALRDGDLPRAVELYRSAIAHRPAPANDDQLALARALVMLGRVDEAWQVIEPLAAADLDPARAAEALWLAGRAELARSETAAAQERFEQALARLAATDRPQLAFEVKHSLFWALWVQGRYTDAMQRAEELVGLGRAGRREEQLCAAKLTLAYAHVVAGDLSQALRLAGEAREHARAVRHVFRELDAEMLLGTVQELVGDYEGALTTLRAARARALKLKATHRLAGIDNVLGRACYHRGDADGALEHFRRAAAAASERRDDRALATALVGEARAHLQSKPQELPRALEAATRALELSAGTVPVDEAEAHAALAEAYLAQGAAAPAQHHGDAAVAMLEDLGAHEVGEVEMLLAGRRAAAANGDDERAASLLGRARRALAERADRIADPAVQRSFVERVPHHARLADEG